MLLGDHIQRALELVGVHQAITTWLPDCNCSTRREALNRLHWWAIRTLAKGKSGIIESLHWLTVIKDATLNPEEIP